MKLVKKGKVKDIYEIDDDKLLFHFSDRISAFDVIMNDEIPGKGEILCKFAKYWFDTLPVANHMLEIKQSDMMIVKKLEMIPIECIVRGYMYGSFYERYVKNQSLQIQYDFPLKKAEKLPQPVFDPTTKSESHDIPITKDQIIGKIVSEDEFDFLQSKSIELYTRMDRNAEKSGFMLADVKFEFGKDKQTGNILLGDSLGPDEFRLWKKSIYEIGKNQESYDKQILRDWLISIGFKQYLEDCINTGITPQIPSIPEDIRNKIYERYLHAYRDICLV